MIKKLLTSMLFVFTLISAHPAMAQVSSTGSGGGICSGVIGNVDNIADVFALGICILRSAIVPLLITLAVVIFIWGIVKFISKADEPGEREEGRQFMMYGIVALFVLVSIWGLVGIIQGTFGVGTDTLIPQLQEV